MERMIEDHLNSKNHIRIAQICMKRLAKLLGCKPDSVKIEGNTSYFDFERDAASMNIWQSANKIIFMSFNEYKCNDDMSEAARQLCMAGYYDAKSAIAANCMKHKTI